MAEKIPVKAVFTGSDVTALGEFATTDTIPITNMASILATSITDSDLTHAPNGNAVFDALAGKASLTGTETLTNKRFTPRVLGTTSSATPSINTDNCDIYQLTAQTADITSFNMSGTPVEGDCLIIEITGTGARAIDWNGGTDYFESSTVTLPTTTVTTAKLTVGFLYNDVTNLWRCVGAV